MKNIKKIICLCTAFLMITSLFSCNSSKNNKELLYSGQENSSAAGMGKSKDKNSRKLTTYYDEIPLETSTNYSQIFSMKYSGDKLYLLGKTSTISNSFTNSTDLDTLETSQIQKDSSIPDDMEQRNVYKDSKGNIYNCTYRELEIYDKNLDLIKTIDTKSIEGHEELKDTFFYASTVSENGDIYIAASQKTSDSMQIIKLNSSFEVQFVTEKNDFSDCGDRIIKLYIGENGNPVLCTESDCIYINEISPDSGRTVLRYDIPLAEEVVGGYKDYNVIYRNGNTISGYNYLNNTTTELYSPDEDVSQINSSYIRDNSLITEQTEKGNGESVLSIYGNDGKEVENIVVSGIDMINDMCISNDGSILLLNENYKLEYTDDGAFETTQAEIIRLKKDGTTETVYKGEKNYSETYHVFSVDSKGNICICPSQSFDSSSIQATYISSDGIQTDMEYEANGSISDVLCINDEFNILFSSYDKETPSLSILSVDKDLLTLNDPTDTDISPCSPGAGSNGYDFYYSTGNTISGYKISDASSEKIFSWFDSDVELIPDVRRIAIADPENIFYIKNNDYYDDSTAAENLHPYSIIHLKKADEARLEELNSRSIITLAGINIDETYFLKIKQFNKTNDKYMIAATDYSQYDTNTYADNTAGLSKLETDIAQGNIPDVILGNWYFNIQNFLSKDAFVDLTDLMRNDPDIDNSDLSENILDACKYNGKLYCIPYMLSLSTMAVSDGSIQNSNTLTYDEFFNLTDSSEGNTFIDSSREYLSRLLISSYINDNADFEKSVCDFQTDIFKKLLETLKKCVPESVYYSEEYERGDETLSEYPFKIDSVGQIYDFYYTLVGNDYPHISYSLKGIPSSSNVASLMNINSYLCITNSAENKEGAWEFIKHFAEITNTNEQDEYSYGYSGSLSIFKSKNMKSIDDTIENMTGDAYFEGYDTDIEKYRTNVNALLNGKIINDMGFTDLNKIINEEADKYYNDAQSVDETVSAIQSKVKLYLSEIK